VTTEAAEAAVAPPAQPTGDGKYPEISGKYTSAAGSLDLMVIDGGVEVRYEAVFTESGAHCRCAFRGTPNEGAYRLDDAGMELVFEGDHIRLRGPVPGCCGAIWPGDVLDKMMDLPRCEVAASTRFHGQPVPGSETGEALNIGDQVDVLDPVFRASDDFFFARKAETKPVRSGYLKRDALSCPEYLK